MTLREIPGALALGLLASLAAHTLLYGGEHAMGGAYHPLLLDVAAAAVVGGTCFFAALACLGSSHAVDGSILGNRLASRLPGFAPLATSTGLWFILGERIEPRHSDPAGLLTVGVLIGAAWLLLRLTQGAVRLLAGAILAVSRSPFTARRPALVRHPRRLPIVRRSPLLRRRFARPPPIANACA